MKDQFPVPVARVGIIGGGQLGRMLVAAAKRLGCTCVVLDPLPRCPAGQLAGRQIVATYDDADKVRELVEACDVTTFELEAIDTAVLKELANSGHRIRPTPDLLAIIQDKLTQKELLRDANIATAEFVGVDQISPEVFAEFGYPLVQKARRGGYDGRGVAILHAASDFDKHLPVPSYIERFVPAEKELAVLVARGDDGVSCCYPVVEMDFREGENVLDILLAPAEIDPSVAEAAQVLATRTIEAMQGVGVFGVELFLTADGELSVNEVAPRTHNSGHHTIEACITDQFEQHLRAVIGLPLGSTEQLSPAAMLNLLGDPDSQGHPVVSGLAAALSIPGVCVHLYGKDKTTPYRKMGHVTVLDRDIHAARDKAEQVRELITITGEEAS